MPIHRNVDPCRLRTNLEEEPQIGDLDLLCRQWNGVHNRWLQEMQVNRC